MHSEELYRSAVFAIAIGALALWLGAKMVRRPVETTERMIHVVRRGRPLPKWARPHPGVVRPAIRVQGAVLAGFGIAMMILGVYQWVASRGAP